MKKLVVILFITIVSMVSIFADTNEINLTYHEDSYQFFEISYDNEAITKDTNKEVNLFLGYSKPIRVKYFANIGTAQKGITLNLIAINGGFKNTGVDDIVPVNFDYTILYDGENNNIASVDVVCDRENYSHVVVKDVEKYRGQFDVVDLVVTWNKNHNWVAGTYECPIQIWIGTEL